MRPTSSGRHHLHLRLLLPLLLMALPAAVKGQDTILWNSTAYKPNETSTGAPMDAGFRFQLGVFAGSFVPTQANIGQWAANWVSADHTAYVESTTRYADSFAVTSNNAPFTSGKAAYVWGFKGNASSSEWILFRANSWTWGSATSFNQLNWYAKDATAIVGHIDSDGSPYLMKSAAVSNAAPPGVTWVQWVATDLAGTPMNGQHDDPDGDGTSNILEFVFGTNPKVAGPPVATPVSVVDGHLVISIPRRTDRPASLVVQVSSDLVTWNSGPLYTETLSDGVAALVVRDLIATSPSEPKRFMRLKVSLP